jgi:hypothetical protein
VHAVVLAETAETPHPAGATQPGRGHSSRTEREQFKVAIAGASARDGGTSLYHGSITFPGCAGFSIRAAVGMPAMLRDADAMAAALEDEPDDY